MEKYKKIFGFSTHKATIVLALFFITACNKGTTPTPDPPEAPVYANCVVSVSSNSFDILTWNLKNFPMTNAAIEEVATIIITADVDLVALQEISSASAFNLLLAELPGWEGEIWISGNLNLAYLYKTVEVSVTPLTAIYENNSSPFPRAPIVTTATHTSGISATMVNIHLKCCDGAANVARRTEASTLLKEYIDTQKPDDPVIILGDYNDEISTALEPTPFQNFIDAPAAYEFVDMDIANNEALGWSYPSWPSHIDHILITNELFNNLQEVATLKLNECNSSYSSIVSDHRPVVMRLEQ